MRQNYSNPLVTYDEIVNALKAIIDCSLNDNYLDDFSYLNTRYESVTKTKLDSDMELALQNAIKDLDSAIDTSSKVIKNNLEKEIKKMDDNILQLSCNYLIGHEKRKLAASEGLIRKLRDASVAIDVLYQAPQVEPGMSLYENIDTNKIFSDFERKAIINFPDFFKEELAIARGEDYDNKEDDAIDVGELYSTMDLTSIINHDYNKVEKDIEDEFVTHHPVKKHIDYDRVVLIRRAIAKAKEKNDPKLVEMLEERLDKELGVEI